MTRSVAGYIDRDLILSPNKTHEQHGKILFYNPSSTSTISIPQQHQLSEQNGSLATVATETSIVVDSTKVTPRTIYDHPFDQNSSTVPWEEPLKYAIYLVLNNKVDNGNQQNTRFVKIFGVNSELLNKK